MIAASLRHVRPLSKGDALAVVAPSGPFDREGLAGGRRWWSDRGFAIADYTEGSIARGYLSDEDAGRAEQLRLAIAGESRWIHCARGGYGAGRVLEAAGRDLRALLRDRPMGIMGFSDVTALHSLWSSAGLRSVHGPMLAALGTRLRQGADISDSDEAAEVLAGAPPRPWQGLEVWSWPDAERERIAPAVGGNLAVLCSLCGTPWQPSLAGRVLFVEDVGEAPYRVDRMLTQLRLAGALDGVRGVVIGDFSDCAPRNDLVTVESVLRERFGAVGCPVLAGAPFGHAGTHRPWVQGAKVSLHRDGSVTHLEGVAE